MARRRGTVGGIYSLDNEISTDQMMFFNVQVVYLLSLIRFFPSQAQIFQIQAIRNKMNPSPNILRTFRT